MSATVTNTGHSLEDVLDPSFVPSRLTKAELRSILLEYGDIPLDEFPNPSTKKDILVKIFKDRILARRPEILNAINTRASPTGIVSVRRDGKEEKIGNNFTQENPFQSPIRSPSRGRAIESERDTKQRMPSRKRSSTPKPVAGNEVGRKRRSASVVVEIVETVPKSPLFTAAPEKGRAAKTRSNFKEKSRSPSKSRSSAKVRSSSRASSPSKTSRSPARMKSSETSVSYRSPSKTRGLPAYAFMMPPETLPSVRSKATQKPKGREAKTCYVLWIFLVMLSISSIASFIYVYKPFFSALPFCPSPIARMVTETFIHAPSSTGDEMPVSETSWSSLLLAPFISLRLCWECPLQASCGINSASFTCEPGYYSARHFLTQRPYCRIDLKQQGTVDALSFAIERVLRRILGEHICAGGTFETSPFVSASMISERFASMEGPWNFNTTTSGSFMASHRFEAFLAAALARIAGRPESFDVRTEKSAENHETWFRARLPFFSIRCHLKMFAMRHKLEMFIFICACILLLWIRRIVIRSRILGKEAPSLTDAVIDKLIQQEFLNRQDAVLFPASVPVPQLRDALLATVSVPESLKRDLWKEVTRRIHSNSNVRESTTMIRGEQHRVWEWIGPEVLKASSTGDISQFGRRSISSPLRSFVQ